ncbi:MAG: chorismate-binding protein, partial [Bacteroidaceae bacterium]
TEFSIKPFAPTEWLALNWSAIGQGEVSCNRKSYFRAFETVKKALNSGEADKVVLARCVKVSSSVVNLRDVFARACRDYPACYVSLVEIEGYGAWITASPELLYGCHEGQGHTVAVAATMLWSEYVDGRQWTDKEVAEQQIVARYIREKLSLNRLDFCEAETTTIKAARLAHIKTAFTINNMTDADTLNILKTLHPTPAVSGFPVSNAIETIERAEGVGFRRYYAGFSGFVNHPLYETECYVSLRFMEADQSGNLNFYAGGGIMPQSNAESEWNETSHKLNTLMRLITGEA